MKKMRLFVLLSLLLSVVAVKAAEIGFSGDVTLVSTYVWRGIKQFDGAALQSTGAFSYGPLTVGLWMSSFNGVVPVETDPYVSVALPTGEIETSLGAALFSYDFFSKREYSVYELSASAAYGPFSGNFYFVPKQEFTKDNETVQLVPDALYWIELAAGTTFKGADLSATLSYGTYSAFFTTGGAEKTATNLLLSAGKDFTENIAVSWNWGIALDDYTDNIFFLRAGYAF
jgi:uncharacterized protein (TIGR02001 family)